MKTECVEICPWCMTENLYDDYDCEVEGYVVHCHECGAEIMLCDECLHNDDNPKMCCDWQHKVMNGREYGLCFRGGTINKLKEGENE